MFSKIIIKFIKMHRFKRVSQEKKGCIISLSVIAFSEIKISKYNIENLHCYQKLFVWLHHSNAKYYLKKRKKGKERKKIICCTHLHYLQIIAAMTALTTFNGSIRRDWFGLQVDRDILLSYLELTGGNWQKWKRVFLKCPCHEIYRDEAVGLKSCKNTWKITIFVKMWNLGQYRENLIFCQ